MTLMISEIVTEVRNKGAELTLALASSDWQRAAGLTDEIHSLAVDLKGREREVGARTMMGEVFACITSDLHEEGTKGRRDDWDGRIKTAFGSSLHFGTDKRRWYYLTPSALQPFYLRVEVSVADAKDCERDRQDRTVQLHGK